VAAGATGAATAAGRAAAATAVAGRQERRRRRRWPQAISPAYPAAAVVRGRNSETDTERALLSTCDASVTQSADDQRRRPTNITRYRCSGDRDGGGGGGGGGDGAVVVLMVLESDRRRRSWLCEAVARQFREIFREISPTVLTWRPLVSLMRLTTQGHWRHWRWRATDISKLDYC